MLSCWFVVVYGVLVNVNKMVLEVIKLLDGSIVFLLFVGLDIYNFNWENLGLSWGVLFLYLLIYLGLIIWFKK